MPIFHKKKELKKLLTKYGRCSLHIAHIPDEKFDWISFFCSKLNASYQEALKSVFILKTQQQQKHEEQQQTDKGDVPHLSSRAQLKNRRLLQDNLSQLWNNLRLYLDATKHFEG